MSIYFALFRLCESENGGTNQALGNLCGDSSFEMNTCRAGADDGGVAKKEMARRTGLSVPTVRKYLKKIRRPPGFPAPSERPPTVLL